MTAAFLFLATGMVVSGCNSTGNLSDSVAGSSATSEFKLHRPLISSFPATEDCRHIIDVQAAEVSLADLYFPFLLTGLQV